MACSFVTLVTPAAVGGAALNVRYLRRAKVAPADAVASVGVSQVIALALHLILLVIFAALTGTAARHLAPAAGLGLHRAGRPGRAAPGRARRAGRPRLLLSRLTTTLGQVIPRLLDIAQRPAKLAEGIGGALLVTAAYIGCLDVSVRAFGGSLSLVAVAVVYLTGNAIGSAVPDARRDRRGGRGPVGRAYRRGLHGAAAFSAVLLFRTVTFWLPVPVGWVALNYLQRQDAL